MMYRKVVYESSVKVIEEGERRNGQSGYKIRSVNSELVSGVILVRLFDVPVSAVCVECILSSI